MNNKDCNHQFHTNCKSQNTSSEDSCCVSGIKDSLGVIKECVYSTANIPGFGVNLIITLTNGLKYEVGINAGTLNQITIYDKYVVIGDTTISLCEIAKIKILTHGTTNQSFLKCLKHKLCKITRQGTKCSSNDDYLAISKDDEYYYNSCKCNSCKPNHCNCSPCKKCGATCKNDCSCKKAMEKRLSANKDDVETIGFEGGGSYTTVNSVEDIDYKNVLNSAKITTNTVPLVSRVELVYDTIPVASNVGSKTTNVVNAVNLQPTTVVTNIKPTSTTILKDVTTSSVTVVNNVNLLSPIKNLTDITIETTSVTQSVSTEIKNVLADVSLLPSKVITDVVTNTVTAITSLGTPSTASAITNLGPLPTTLALNSITVETTPITQLGAPSLSSVVTNIEPLTTTVVTKDITSTPTTVVQTLGTPNTIPAITNITPTTETVIGGITAVSTTVTSSVSIPVFTPNTLIPGDLVVVIPPGAIFSQGAASLPATTITLGVKVNNTTISFGGFVNAQVLSGPATLLNVAGTSNLTTVVKDLGTPKTQEVLSYSSPQSITVVETVVPTTIDAATGLGTINTATITAYPTSTEIVVVKDVKSTPVDVATGLGTITTETVVTAYPTPETQDILSADTVSSVDSNLVNSKTPTTITSVLSAPTIEVLKTVTATSVVISPINSTTPVSTISINNVTGKTQESVVKDVPFDTQNINGVLDVSEIDIEELGTVDYKDAVSNVSIKAYYKDAVSNVKLDTTNTKVVKDIDIKEVNVVAAEVEPINGNIICVGEGIMVVEEACGDISIYSICEINSFTLR